MVGLHRAVFGRNRGALDQRQQIALNTLAAHRTAAHVADGDLVDLVEEHDPVRFRIGQRDPAHLVLVEPLVGFLFDELFPGRAHADLAALHLLPAAERLAHHVGKIDHADLPAARNLERHLRIGLKLELDFLVVEMPVGESLAKRLARRGRGILAGQRIEQAVHRRFLGLVLHRQTASLLLQPDRFLDQIARNLLHVAADIADFGEFGRFHLHERRISQLGQPPRNLGLAAPGGADHQDVLGRHLVAQIGIELLAPPAIAERHGDGALGVPLADDVLIERGDDRLGGQLVVHETLRMGRQGYWSAETGDQAQRSRREMAACRVISRRVVSGSTSSEKSPRSAVPPRITPSLRENMYMPLSVSIA